MNFSFILINLSSLNKNFKLSSDKLKVVRILSFALSLPGAGLPGVFYFIVEK
jgi:hypothetical protein